MSEIPDQGRLVAAAHSLKDGHLPDARVLALWTQWARLDPRFAEILVGALARGWESIAFGEFTAALARLPWPRAAEVLFRFANLGLDEERLRTFANGIASLFPSESGTPLFFIPLQWPNAVVIRDEIAFNADIYARAGFVGSQCLGPHARWPNKGTHLTDSARAVIVESLLRGGSEVTVHSYRAACRGLVSVRQAQRDLLKAARPRGFTRSRRYQR